MENPGINLPKAAYGDGWPTQPAIPDQLTSANWTIDATENPLNPNGPRNRVRPYVQQTFLGCTVVDFNVNGGFGDTSSSLSVSLVQDEYNKSDRFPLGIGDDPYHNGLFDLFRAPPVGTPVFFKFGPNYATIPQAWAKTFDDLYGYNTIGILADPTLSIQNRLTTLREDKDFVEIGFSNTPEQRDYAVWSYNNLENLNNKDRGYKHFSFGGILQNYNQDSSNGGDPKYNVTVVDPREILSNTTMILNNYSNSIFGLPNLFNVFGFLEYNPTKQLREDINAFYRNRYLLEKIINTDGSVSYRGGYDTSRNINYPLFTDSYVTENWLKYVSLKSDDIARNNPPSLEQFPNVFPYTGTSYSRRTDTGIPMYRIVQAMNAMMGFYGEIPEEYASKKFGSYINFRGFNYVVDFGGLPINKVPISYSLDFDQMNLLEFCQEICDVTSHDFHVSLLPVIDHPSVAPLHSYNVKKTTEGKYSEVIVGIIRIDAVDRSKKPNYGSISRFINQLKANGSEIINSKEGFELSNVPTDKFVVGAQEVNMYLFTNNGDRDNLEVRKEKAQVTPNNAKGQVGEQWMLSNSLRQQILPFYGFLGKDCVTIPRGYGSFQQILLDASSLNANGVGYYYVATEMELRAASISYESWKDFLLQYNDLYLESMDEDDVIQAAYVNVETVPTALQASANTASYSEKFAVTVPRSVFESSMDHVRSNKVAYSPCNPPYGWPLYYKRATAIGLPEAGLAGFTAASANLLKNIQDFKNKDDNKFKQLKNSEWVKFLEENIRIGASPEEKSFIDFIKSEIAKNPEISVLTLIEDQIKKGDYLFKNINRTAEEQNENALKVYNFVKNVASNLGTKFLVKIPKETNPFFDSNLTLKENSNSVQTPADRALDQARIEFTEANEAFIEAEDKYIEAKEKAQTLQDSYDRLYDRYSSIRESVLLTVGGQQRITSMLEEIAKVFDKMIEVRDTIPNLRSDRDSAESELNNKKIGLENAEIAAENARAVERSITTQNIFEIEGGPFGFIPREVSDNINYKNSSDFIEKLNKAREYLNQQSRNKFNYILGNRTDYTAITALDFTYQSISEALAISSSGTNIDLTNGALKSEYDPISDSHIFNYMPEPQGGFFDFDLYANKLTLDEINKLPDSKKPNLMKSMFFPPDATNFLNDNRISSYVRFDNSQYLDFSSIPPEAFSQVVLNKAGLFPDILFDLPNTYPDKFTSFSSNSETQKELEKGPKTCAFVKCEVDAKFYMAPKYYVTETPVFAREAFQKHKIRKGRAVWDEESEKEVFTLPVYEPDFEPSLELNKDLKFKVERFQRRMMCIDGSEAASGELTFRDRHYYDSRGKRVIGNIIKTEPKSQDPYHVYALITLPGPIRSRIDQRFSSGMFQNEKSTTIGHILTQDVVKDVPGFDSPMYKLQTSIDSTPLDSGGEIKLKNLFKLSDKKASAAMMAYKSALETAKYSFNNTLNIAAPSPVYPDLVAIPLMSRERCYGPWISSYLNSEAAQFRNTPGKIEFIKDENLSPWSYNGYDLMDEAGMLQAEFSNSLMPYAENGNISFNGLPDGNSLLKPLIQGGPLVTSIDISVDSSNGVTTTYNLASYTPRFGNLQKQKSDLISKISRERQKQKDAKNISTRKGLNKLRDVDYDKRNANYSFINGANSFVETMKEKAVIMQSSYEVTNTPVIFQNNGVNPEDGSRVNDTQVASSTGINNEKQKSVSLDTDVRGQINREMYTTHGLPLEGTSKDVNAFIPSSLVAKQDPIDDIEDLFI